MVADQGQHGIEEIDALQHVDPDHRVFLHPERLIGLEPSLLAEDHILDADLADVVKHAGAPKGADLCLGGPERLRHDDGILLNPLGVAVGVGIARLDRRRQRLDRHQVSVLELGHRGPKRGALLFKATGHLVEGVGERADLVPRRHRRLVLEVAGAD